MKPFLGNAKIFSGTPKKVVQKFRLKFGPPGSEVLDPLESSDSCLDFLSGFLSSFRMPLLSL